MSKQYFLDVQKAYQSTFLLSLHFMGCLSSKTQIATSRIKSLWVNSPQNVMNRFVYFCDLDSYTQNKTETKA